jgi:hypothetical protein
MILKLLIVGISTAVNMENTAGSFLQFHAFSFSPPPPSPRPIPISSFSASIINTVLAFLAVCSYC